MDNYNQLLQFISDNSDKSIEDIERQIEAKQAKLSGLISKEGAAQVIAAELGINFDKQIMKISQIVPGMRKLNLVGKIITLFPIKEYEKNGRSGRIGSFILADETSNIRTVLWDENHIDLIAKGEINQDGIVEITNASVRNGEIHLNSFSEIKSSEKEIKEVIVEKPTFVKTISDFNANEDVSSRAFIVQMFEPKFFEVCPECRKKAINNECVTHGSVVPERRALLNFVIDDGTDSIRAVVFSDELKKIIPQEELESPELFAARKKELLGKEFIIGGQVRTNKMYGNQEFIVRGFQEIDLDKLIEELESK
jgi:replication factor A1